MSRLTRTAYTSLPGRVIISSPFLERSLVSYGIIAYARDTSRWLLVNRQNSPEFIVLVRGSYRLSEIPRLLPGLCVTEVDTLKRVLAAEQHWEPLFSVVFRKTVDGSAKDYVYARTRFEEVIPLLKESLASMTGKQETEWLWPKGRLASASEVPYRCAVREFSEETGVPLRLSNNGALRLPLDASPIGQAGAPSPVGAPCVAPPHSVGPANTSPPVCINTSPLIESFRGANGRIYETRCWVIVFSQEIPLLPIENESRPNEIGARRWVTEQEARELLQPNKLKVLLEASRLINAGDKAKSMSMEGSVDTSPTENVKGADRGELRTDRGELRTENSWRTVTRKRR